MPTVIYNDYELPDTIDKFSLTENEKDINFSCTFLIVESTASALISECETMKTALTEKNKSLTLDFSGSGELDYSHLENTGFLARPTITKITNQLATETSRAYKFSVNIKLPFNQEPYNYRLEGSFSIAYAPTRQRTVNFSCVYTAGGEYSALENYTANVYAWTASVLTALGGTYEKISENIQEEHEEKILNGKIQYQEILAKQSSSNTDVSSIINPRVNYSVTFAQEKGICLSNANYDMVPLATVRISYSTAIDKNEVGTDTGLEDVYQDTVKPWLISHVYDVLGLSGNNQAGSQYIVQSEQKSVDSYNYQISGNIVLSAPRSLTEILALNETLVFRWVGGISKRKLYDGRDYTYSRYGIGAELTLARTITISKLGTPPLAPPPYINERPGTWQLESFSNTDSKQRIGAGTVGSNLNAVDLYKSTFNEQYTYTEDFIGNFI